jgi:hypothetical protein
MTGKEIKNVTASVLAKLRNNSKSSGAPLQQVLQLYAMERFLYRVSKSRHAQSVILKGALLLKTIGIPSARPTVDIDMLRKGKADHASLVALIRDCAALEVEADGLAFIADSVVAEDIAKDSEYKGTRVLMDARMDNVRLKIQIDFGVGDVMVPGPRMIEYPVFLGGDTIHLLAYPIESSIAEKLQAMVALGNANSRMKDFYDVWICSKHLDLDADTLLKAIDATFKIGRRPFRTTKSRRSPLLSWRDIESNGTPSSERSARPNSSMHLAGSSTMSKSLRCRRCSRLPAARGLRSSGRRGRGGCLERTTAHGAGGCR